MTHSFTPTICKAAGAKFARALTLAFTVSLVPGEFAHGVFTSSAQAQTATTPAQQSGTDVEAEEMEIIDAENRTVFKGNVVAKRDDQTINADELVVLSAEIKQADGSMKKEVDVMKASGKVKIVTENETITAERADIYDREDRLEAFGNVVLVQGGNTLKGQKLTVNLNTKRTVMTGGRVKGSFLPN
jgi:lipopolysaccharide export system protein LptA